jgi:pimeloyl-ACP methyl ester carboxylesterase
VSSIEVNGIRIYYEKRGRGPAVLFVSGATGDAGHWTTVADILADTYTVITYDRRANSRTCGCRKSMPPGDTHESRLRHGRGAGPGTDQGR